MRDKITVVSYNIANRVAEVDIGDTVRTFTTPKSARQLKPGMALTAENSARWIVGQEGTTLFLYIP
jgi:hypothetical protein